MSKEIVKRGPMGIERRKRIQAQFLQFMLDKEIYDFNEAARAISNGDPKKAKRWRLRWQRWMQGDVDFQQAVAEMCMGMLRGGLPATITALNRRAAKGNVPAQKLAMEASRFYSPRTTHEHSGDIAITLKGVTRPVATVDETVADAEVVEDD